MIFPCCPIVRQRPRPPPINVDLPRSESMLSSAYSTRTSTTLPLSDTWPSAIEESFDHIMSKKYSLSPILDSPPSSFNYHIHPIEVSQWDTVRSSFLSSDPEPEPEELDIEHDAHPQDHSKLKASWDSMLSSRFLSPNITTVLPFYLSSCFIDVQSHPLFQVPLPPNSSSSSTSSKTSQESLRSWFDPDQQFNIAPYSGRKSNEAEMSSMFSSDRISHKSIPTSEAMHLARAVKTVTSCKEAIWAEYRKLYNAELPPVTRTSRPKDVISQASQSSAREGFEKAWSNWEKYASNTTFSCTLTDRVNSDMMDRISMRGRIDLELCWFEPPGERPDWRMWRSNINPKTDATIPSSIIFCRSLRGFVAHKSRS